MKKDEYIWSTYKKLGIEAARSYITEDSIYVVNRLQRYYQAEPFDRVWQLISFPLSIGEMQDIIVGNLPVPDEKDILNFQKTENNYLLRSKYKGNIYTYLIDGKSMVVTKVLLEDRGDRLEVDYGQFMEDQGVKRPQKIDIKVDTRDLKAQLVLKIVETEWEKMKDASFTIPSRYERMGF
jgi:hypothetical protein